MNAIRIWEKYFILGCYFFVPFHIYYKIKFDNPSRELLLYLKYLIFKPA